MINLYSVDFQPVRRSEMMQVAKKLVLPFGISLGILYGFRLGMMARFTFALKTSLH